MFRGVNAPRLGDFNQRVVLDSIRRRPAGISRVELAGLTGLSAQTISNATRRLIESGLVHDVGRTVDGPGKPRTQLGVNRHGMFSLGIHLDPALVDVTLLDLGGNVVDQSRHWLPDSASPAEALAHVAQSVEGLFVRHPGVEGLVVGAGIGVPGPLNPAGEMIDPPLMRGWHLVPVAQELERVLDLPIVLEKDAIAAAQGEVWLGGASSFIYAYLGTGIGMGLVTGGTPQRGVSGNLGEVGHVGVDRDEPSCPCCGRRGTLGSRVSPAFLESQAVAAGLLEPSDQTMVQLDRSLQTLAGLARAGRPEAMAIIEDLAVDMADALSRVSDLLDVDKVVLGGHSWTHVADVALPLLRQFMARSIELGAVREVDVTSSCHAGDVVSVGAAALVLDGLLTPHYEGLSRWS